MSIRVMTWVWDHATVSSSGELLVLLAIADHADDDGANAWPSVGRLAARTRVSTRTVQRLITRLEERGLLMIERQAGHRTTNRYTIVMTVRPSPGTQRARDNPVLPVDDHASAVDKGVTNCHPDNLSGVTSVQDPRQNVASGVTLLSPEPSRTTQNHPAARDPSPALVDSSDRPAPSDGASRASPDDPPATGVPGVAVEQVLELDARRVLAGLGEGWPISPREMERLVPAVRAALTSGWSAEQLRATLSRNAGNVRSPAAVLRARLDAIRPVAVPGATARPPWCGRCDSATRHRERDDDALYRCPECHPLAANRHP